ncbi:MAG: prepilin-type N-terminal cleavage/methylation domain-containing protein [Bacteroidota bacterium]
MNNHYIFSKHGFTFIEIIIVMAIIILVTSVSIFSYNSFTQNIDLNKANDLVGNVFESTKMSVLNGETYCSEMAYKKNQRFFYVVEYNNVNCKSKKTLFRTLQIGSDNVLTLGYENYDKDLIAEVFDANSHRDEKKIQKGSNEITFPLGNSLTYNIFIYDPLNKVQTLNKIYVHFFAESSADPVRSDHIISEKIAALDASGEEKIGDEVRILFMYPSARANIFLDNAPMKGANIYLSKNMTAIDPTIISLADFFGGTDRKEHSFSVVCDEKGEHNLECNP